MSQGTTDPPPLRVVCYFFHFIYFMRRYMWISLTRTKRSRGKWWWQQSTLDNISPHEAEGELQLIPVDFLERGRVHSGRGVHAHGSERLHFSGHRNPFAGKPQIKIQTENREAAVLTSTPLCCCLMSVKLNKLGKIIYCQIQPWFPIAWLANASLSSIFFFF